MARTDVSCARRHPGGGRLTELVPSDVVGCRHPNSFSASVRSSTVWGFGIKLGRMGRLAWPGLTRADERLDACGGRFDDRPPFVSIGPLHWPIKSSRRQGQKCRWRHAKQAHSNTARPLRPPEMELLRLVRTTVRHTIRALAGAVSL